MSISPELQQDIADVEAGTERVTRPGKWRVERKNGKVAVEMLNTGREPQRHDQMIPEEREDRERQMTQAPTPGPLSGERYRKKPVVIEAIQWTGDNLRSVITFADGPPDTRSHHASMKWDEYADLVARDGLRIFTREDGPDAQVKHYASVGDFIIRGVQGELYACKPDIFAATYEPASLAPAAPVEASGSEQLRARATHGEYSLHNFPDDPDADHSVWSIFHTTESGGMEVASGMERATADLLLAALLPQPSGETREAVARLTKDVATVKSFSANIATFYGGPDKRYIGDVAADIETVLALLSAHPAPVASGGQHSSATDFPPDDVLACVESRHNIGEDIKQALTLALELLGQMEPPDARAMSNEFVAMASALAGIQNQEGRDIIAARLKQPFPSVPAEVTFTDVPAQDDDKLRIAVEALGVISRASARSETMFGGKMSDVTRVFQNITRVSEQAIAALKSTAAPE